MCACGPTCTIPRKIPAVMSSNQALCQLQAGTWEETRMMDQALEVEVCTGICMCCSLGKQSVAESRGACTGEHSPCSWDRVSPPACVQAPPGAASVCPGRAHSMHGQSQMLPIATSGTGDGATWQGPPCFSADWGWLQCWDTWSLLIED